MADTPDYAPSPWEPIRDHVERYLATGGAEGFEWNGAQCIVLTTTGRKSGALRRSPLIRVAHGDGYLVVASMGGAPKHPEWYLNLLADPDVTVHDRDQAHALRARVAAPEEKAALWPLVTEQWPDYDAYQAKTDRDIPLVVLEPR
jgi:deazaflavin-dependent oxidoreductase (nitroreductase family)